MKSAEEKVIKVTLKQFTQPVNEVINVNDKVIRDNFCLKSSGESAGVCYMPDTYEQLISQPTDKKVGRALSAIKNVHHSVMGHISATVVIEGIPKICAMLLNSIQDYNTSEKSARYTKMADLPEVELNLYNKWLGLFKKRITELEPNLDSNKVEKLAMENARGLTSVFTPTTMEFTTTIQEFNYIIDWVEDLNERLNMEFGFEYFYVGVYNSMREVTEQFKELFYIDGLRDMKGRGFSFFMNPKRESAIDYVGEVYDITTKGSFMFGGQLERHRTTKVQMKFRPSNKIEFYVPPMIAGTDLEILWLYDLESLVKDGKYPQAIMVEWRERGTVENFLLKTKERLCGCAQHEIMLDTMNKVEMFRQSNNLLPWNEHAVKKLSPTRCGEKGYKCTMPCHWGRNADKRLV